MAELCIANCDDCQQRQRSVSFASNEAAENAIDGGDDSGGGGGGSEGTAAEVPIEQQQTGQEEEPRVNLFLCCFSFPLFTCARLVGWLSAVPLLLAMLLLPFVSSSIFDLIPELILLGFEMLCVLALFFGLQHQQSNYLRPFLFFGVVWNLALFLLLLFAVFVPEC